MLYNKFNLSSSSSSRLIFDDIVKQIAIDDFIELDSFDRAYNFLDDFDDYILGRFKRFIETVEKEV